MNVEKDVVQILNEMKSFLKNFVEWNVLLVCTLRFETVGWLHDFWRDSLRFSSRLNKSSTFDGTVCCSSETIPSCIASITAINVFVQVVRSFDVVFLQRA